MKFISNPKLHYLVPIISNRDPSHEDFDNTIGQMWINEGDIKVYLLIMINLKQCAWIRIDVELDKILRYDIV